ncbi:MAG: prepilin-type N-terminal cleavage/methylation domain-containing protein [Rhodocyclales bacterium]|nr:prepilin-type N-terminal cleavage/methylation domain-containing protein [Rhodocyclales bacterium]
MTVVVRPQAAHAIRKLSVRRYRGFTLVELMVVVVIIAILASIALPAYNDYVTRGRIPDATANLANKRAQIELFYDNNHTYAGGIPDCAASDTTTSRYFAFNAVCGPTTYVIAAAGVGTMAGFTYTIDQTNAKATTTVPAGWTANAGCWVTKKDGTC